MSWSSGFFDLRSEVALVVDGSREAPAKSGVIVFFLNLARGIWVSWNSSSEFTISCKLNYGASLPLTLFSAALSTEWWVSKLLSGIEKEPLFPPSRQELSWIRLIVLFFKMLI